MRWPQVVGWAGTPDLDCWWPTELLDVWRYAGSAAPGLIGFPSAGVQVLGPVAAGGNHRPSALASAGSDQPWPGPQRRWPTRRHRLCDEGWPATALGAPSGALRAHLA